MKRAAMVIAMLGMSAWGIAQSNDKPGAQSPPTGQSTGQAAAPAGKMPPQAKTSPVYAVYMSSHDLSAYTSRPIEANDYLCVRNVGYAGNKRISVDESVGGVA